MAKTQVQQEDEKERRFKWGFCGRCLKTRIL
jgi:hypothetical protein